ncbi:MAG TPA: TonB-dependent siderophore receptor [Opitutaceae bacterium]|jgi:catecholate siderophore receptor
MQPKTDRVPRSAKLAALGAAAVGMLAPRAIAQEAQAAAQAGPVTSLPPLEVTGTVSALPHDVPQAVTSVTSQVISDQAAVSLEEVLKNVPGITLNAGEGGSHGDSVNLRGLSIPDSFFIDGLRDIGLYQRDSFDEEAVEVLLGPSSVVFGRGSTAGVINQVTKQAELQPIGDASLELGSAGFERATADVDAPIGANAAARVNLMAQRFGTVDRDDVLTRSFGFAPTVALGMDTATTLTLSYLHQYEDDIPDYGIPFIDGSPAPVARSNYYGLVNYDRTKNTVDIGTVRLEHKFGDNVSLVESARYGHYGFEYLLSAPHLDDDYTEPPAPGTPLADILIYRDQPSSAGTEEEFIDRTDLTTRFDTGGVAHALVTGIELSNERSDVTRYVNGIDDLPPTPLLDPVPYYSPPTPLEVDTQPDTYGSDVSLSAMDSMKLSPSWDFDAGVRWDRFSEHFSEATSGSSFERADTELSPRAALVFKPDASRSYYASFGSSYNPAIEYLTLAPSSESLAPEKDSTVEVGTKVDLLDRALELNGAVFDTLLDDARQADPDDPTVQQLPFDQRVIGVEVGASGHLARGWEVSASYTHLSDLITSTADPGAYRKRAPNIAQDSANLWITWEPGRNWKLGGGMNLMGQRYADTDNTAGVPAYAVFDAMASYRVNAHLDLQVNVKNLGNALYYNGIYYTEVDENHAVPGPGRTLLVTARVRF